MYNFLLLKMYICRYWMYNSFSSIKMQRKKWISRKFVLWWATIFFWVHIFSTRNIFGTYKQKQGELSTFCHSFVKQASSHTGWFWEKRISLQKGQVLNSPWRMQFLLCWCMKIIPNSKILFHIGPKLFFLPYSPASSVYHAKLYSLIANDDCGK